MLDIYEDKLRKDIIRELERDVAIMRDIVTRDSQNVKLIVMMRDDIARNELIIRALREMR